MRTNILWAVPVALLLAGCTSSWDQPEGEMTADAGLAVRHNIAAQVVNPNAPTERGAFITDGERAFRAVDRYTKGTVTPPTGASPTTKGGDSGDDKDASSNQNTP